MRGKREGVSSKSRKGEKEGRKGHRTIKSIQEERQTRELCLCKPGGAGSIGGGAAEGHRGLMISRCKHRSRPLHKFITFRRGPICSLLQARFIPAAHPPVHTPIYRPPTTRSVLACFPSTQVWLPSHQPHLGDHLCMQGACTHHLEAANYSSETC